MTYLQPRSVSVGGRRTTVRLEAAYWAELNRMSDESGQTIAQILSLIDAENPSNFTSAIRVRVLTNLRASLLAQLAKADGQVSMDRPPAARRTDGSARKRNR